MLDPKTWLHQAEHLDEGRRTRVDHFCGPGRTLLLTSEPHKWTAYCFRCADHGYVPKPVESLSERIARRAHEAAQDASIAADVKLPAPANYDVATWPEAARVWLYKASLGRPEIAELGAYYHQPSGRVVLPVYRNGQVVYWSARSVDGRAPKYLNSPTDRNGLVAKYGKGDVIVLTEDILSAYRVGQVTEAWSLIGVHMNDAIAVQLLRRQRPVVVWLDPDWQYAEGKRPGVIAARKIERALAAMGVPVSRVVSRADPKFLSQREIRKCLSIQ